MIIENEVQYENALKKLEKLIYEDKTHNVSEVENLAIAIEAYEDIHYPISPEKK